MMDGYVPSPSRPAARDPRWRQKRFTAACSVLFLLIALADNSASAYTFTRTSRHNRRAALFAVQSATPRRTHHPGNVDQSSSYLRLRFSKLSMAKSADGRGDGSPANNKAPVDNDERTWKAIYIALQIYKAAFKDLKVPLKFVVPNMKPWPKPCWGMKLGRIVSQIRQQGQYLNDPGTAAVRRQQLDELGFAWQKHSSKRPDVPEDSYFQTQLSLDQLYQALAAYKQIVLNTSGQSLTSWTVPPTFVIPNADPWPENVREMPLGKELAKLSTKLDAEPELQEKFFSLGLTPSLFSPSQTDERDDRLPQREAGAHEARFQIVLTALKRFKELHGDLLVPQPFVVPRNSDWPEETWNLRLGARVNSIRAQGSFVTNRPDRRKQLDEIGFVWVMPKNRTRRGKLKEEPESTETSSSPATEDDANEDLDSFLDDSFDFEKAFGVSKEGKVDPPTWGIDQNEIKASEIIVPPAIETPEEDYSPPRTINETFQIAVKLAKDTGIVLGLTENERFIKGWQHKTVPWFNDDFGDEYVFEDVVDALKIYQNLYGSFHNLTEDFVIPKRKEVTGFLDDDEGSFDELGSEATGENKRFGRQSQRDWEGLGIAQFEKMEEDELGSSGALTGNADANDWPEHFGGWALGAVVARIQDGSLEVKHLPERKKELDALGFDWGDTRRFIDVPFEKTMCAFYAYFMIRGDLLVYEDFVMPDEDPWPQALAGFEIGKAVKRIREIQDIFEAYHPDKLSLLRMMDFLWFPSEMPAMDTETYMLYYFGHPDMKIRSMPLDMLEEIHRDGPFFEVKDPLDRWREWHNWTYVADYWYQQGRRDNAYVLRKMGYPRMADEHEALYGPGLFEQINRTLTMMDETFDDMTTESMGELFEMLLFYRKEMEGCRDLPPEEHEALIIDLEDRIIQVQEAGNFELPTIYGANGEEGYDEDDLEEEEDEGEPEDSDTEAEDDEVNAGSEASDTTEEVDFNLSELGLDEQ